MLAIASLLVIATLSLLVVRVATTALTMTGMSRDVAEFQAYSAFFSVGFTTREAEMVVSHPVRRKIIRHLILIGNVGLTSAAASLVVSFLHVTTLAEGFEYLGLILAGLGVLWLVASSPFGRGAIDRSVRWTLHRAGVVHALDYAMLLRVHAGYCISEVEIDPGHWLVGRTLAESRLGSRGVVVLGITRKDVSYLGTPDGKSTVQSEDVLTVYGMESTIRRLASSRCQDDLPAPDKPRA